MKSRLSHWILALRPKTMLASIGPVILGIALAYTKNHHTNYTIAILTLISAMLLQITTNIANDYLDHKKGIDSKDRIGPVRVTAAGIIPENQMKWALSFLILLSFLSGLYLMIYGGLPIIIIGLLSLYFAYGYSGGPFPLSYNGLGELSAFIFFGLVAVSGTYYLQTFHFDFISLFWGAAVGAISAAILAINNLRDISTDSKTHKKTIAVIFGEYFQRNFILFLILSASLLSIIAAFISFNFYFLIPAILPIFFIKDWKKIYSGTIDSDLNFCLANTAKFLLLYSLTNSFALLMSK
jgi:1,4-dihydroxy-2-naphthoate octaprenyltransferase